MADSTLAALGAHTPVIDANSSYIEAAGVAKKVAASVWKTYVSLSPTLVTPDLGTPTAGVLDNCTGGPTLTSATFVTPALGTPTSGVLDNCTGGPTLTSATLITPALGTPASGDISACTSTSMALTTPDCGVPSAITLTNADGTITNITLVTPVLGTPQSGVLDNCTGGPTLTSATLITPALGVPASGTLTSCDSVGRTVATALTADVGSVQGGNALTKEINVIGTCANPGDATTLPAAAAGLSCTILNNGASATDVFPASGDDCGGGVDTAVSLASGANITYLAIDGTTWFAKT